MALTFFLNNLSVHTESKPFSPGLLTDLSVQLEEGDVVVERLRVMVVVDVGGGDPQSLGAL